MNSDALRDYFKESRRRRGISLQQLANRMTQEFGESVFRSTLANYELHTPDKPRAREPRGVTIMAIRALVAEWQAEDDAAGHQVPEETRARGTAACGGCGLWVLSGVAGAHFCSNCGGRFCGCGQVVSDPSWFHCPRCGQELPGKVATPLPQAVYAQTKSNSTGRPVAAEFKGSYNTEEDPSGRPYRFYFSPSLLPKSLQTKDLAF